MSILIKGVEKPKDCRHCRFLNKTKISSDCKFLTVDYYCDVLEQWKGDAVCPLVELPPHGKWVLKTFDDGYGEYQLYECDQCGAVTAQRKSKNYCPNCGAMMDIEAEGE